MSCKFRWREVGVTIRADHDFCGAFAPTIRIVVTKVIRFPIPPDLFDVFVTLVAGDAKHGTRSFKLSDGLQQRRGSHHVGFEGLERLFVAGTHD